MIPHEMKSPLSTERSGVGEGPGVRCAVTLKMRDES
jgi:hypothetical protein